MCEAGPTLQTDCCVKQVPPLCRAGFGLNKQNQCNTEINEPEQMSPPISRDCSHYVFSKVSAGNINKA